MINFYNTLTKEKQEFIPIDEDEIGMYSCGPTVYKDATIGNMRTYIFMDNLRRVLKYNGYKLKHVMNITDVGHLVSDGDERRGQNAKVCTRAEKNSIGNSKILYRIIYEGFKQLKYRFARDYLQCNR
jgi:cysteinyl-tRNA synthetase